MVVDWQVRAVVVTHHHCGIALDAAAAKRGVATRDETAHPAVADLNVDCIGGVVGIFAQLSALEMVDRIAPAGVLIREVRLQAVDVAAALLERQVAEHVVERAVLQHHDHDRVDLLEIATHGF